MTSRAFERADYERALLARGLSAAGLFHRRVTASTNDDARGVLAAGLLAPGAPCGIVVAESQTRGRGRGENQWSSPEGSVAMTLLLPAVSPSRLPTLPLTVGVAVATSLRGLGADASLKWPNDVLLGDLKVAGILCESVIQDASARVIAGIGVNVSAGATDAKAANRATTLASAGVDADRPTLVADIAARVLHGLAAEEDGATVVRAWRSLAAPWWGQEVTIIEGTARSRVTLVDVDDTGRLIVRDRQGVDRALSSGEVRQIRRVDA